jgi:hypothetical protein
MSVGLVARSRDVEVRHALVPQHPEAIHALGAEIDPRTRRGGGDEEDRLARDEGAVVVSKRVEELGHGNAYILPSTGEGVFQTWPAPGNAEGHSSASAVPATEIGSGIIGGVAKFEQHRRRDRPRRGPRHSRGGTRPSRPVNSRRRLDLGLAITGGRRIGIGVEGGFGTHRCPARSRRWLPHGYRLRRSRRRAGRESRPDACGALRPEKRVTARSKLPQKKWTGLALPRKPVRNCWRTRSA